MVADTDDGKELARRIEDLKELVGAYRKGALEREDTVIQVRKLRSEHEEIRILQELKGSIAGEVSGGVLCRENLRYYDNYITQETAAGRRGRGCN